MSLKARVEKLREQVQASATPDAIQVVDSRVRDDDEAIHQ